MPLPCNKCGQLINFDDGVVSKNGKKIPLNESKTKLHGHDEFGNVVEKPLEPGQYIKQQPRTFPQSLEKQPQRFVSSSPPSTEQQSQGGSYLDTKRLRVMNEELTKQVYALDEKLEACYQLDKSNNDMLGALISFFKINDPKTAAELFKVMENTKNEALKPEPEQQVYGWNAVPNPTDVRREYPVEKTLTDETDEDEDEKKEEGI